METSEHEINRKIKEHLDKNVNVLTRNTLMKTLISNNYTDKEKKAAYAFISTLHKHTQETIYNNKKHFNRNYTIKIIKEWLSNT